MPKALWSECLPIALWPPADRVAWEAAMRPRDPFESDGIATHWSVATRRKTAKGYGRFLCWLKERGELDEAADPIARLRGRGLMLASTISGGRTEAIPSKIASKNSAMLCASWRPIATGASLDAPPHGCAQPRSRRVTNAGACRQLRK